MDLKYFKFPNKYLFYKTSNNNSQKLFFEIVLKKQIPNKA